MDHCNVYHFICEVNHFVMTGVLQIPVNLSDRAGE